MSSESHTLKSPQVCLYQEPSGLSCCGWFWDRHQCLEHQVDKPSLYPLWFYSDTFQGPQATLLPVDVWAQTEGLTLIV